LDIFGNDRDKDIGKINGRLVGRDGCCDQMNGIFSLLRNSFEVNHLFEKIHDWKKILSGNVYTALDELMFTPVVLDARDSGKLKVEFRGWREGDRYWAEHQPKPKIKMLEDGTLINTIRNEEIMMFHFAGCKRWCV